MGATRRKKTKQKKTHNRLFTLLTPLTRPGAYTKENVPSFKISAYSLSRRGATEPIVRTLRQTNKLNKLTKRANKLKPDDFAGYLCDRRSRAPLKKCGMLKLDSAVHRADSDMASESRHRGRCGGGGGGGGAL